MCDCAFVLVFVLLLFFYLFLYGFLLFTLHLFWFWFFDVCFYMFLFLFLFPPRFFGVCFSCFCVVCGRGIIERRLVEVGRFKCDYHEGNVGRPELFNGDISKWDTSSVINMFKLFFRSIGEWDVSRITDMRSLFNEAQPTSRSGMCQT